MNACDVIAIKQGAARPQRDSPRAVFFVPVHTFLVRVNRGAPAPK